MEYKRVSKMEETWRDIEDYEGSYQVSDFGRVRSLDRVTSNNMKVKGKVLASRLTQRGYCRVQLYKGGISEDKYIHQLVGIYFLININNYTDINHKDGVKSNNCAWNLEWCSKAQNSQHSYYVLKNQGSCIPKRDVKGVNLKNNKVVIFETIANAKRWLRENGYPKATSGNITSVCKGNRNHAYGYKWEYQDKDKINKKKENV